MTETLLTPGWLIDHHRDDLLALRDAHASAFRFYRKHIYEKRPNYTWRHHVISMQEEVVHQIQESFSERADSGLATFENRADLFLLVLPTGITIRFMHMHKRGHPNLNGTRQTKEFFAQSTLFEDDVEPGPQHLVAGSVLDPTWEMPQAVTMNFYYRGKRAWRFHLEDAEMHEIHQQYRRAQ